MAVSPGLDRPFRHLPHRRPWSRGVLACSAALHALAFALAGWATRGGYEGPLPLPVVRTTWVYAVYYLVPKRSEARPEARPDRSPAGSPRLTIAARKPVRLRLSTPDSGSKSGPAQSWVQVKELPPGAVAGMGRLITARRASSSDARGLLAELGFRVPRLDEIPARPGLSRVAELVSEPGSACPDLPMPGTWARRDLTVAVAFAVDTNGRVDGATLQVVESPGRPREDQPLYSHIYAVSSRVRPDPGDLEPAVYDSIVSREVAGHVADLVFRPALKDGRPARSRLLISCQVYRPR